ncbi:fumarylacetoacetate hydrolase family protein [Crocinitomicaceae bacterium]|nr:fumarylacetoacetate hydrolase family protein [Crocinitomicaceae bacterium]MDB3907546.1 fumarylacetoacetate hydrolase family protein [Crocinitomicaceae bacterium]
MKIICIGRNYADHAKEMSSAIPKSPMFFMKPDVALLKAGNDFYYPGFSKDVHFECEIVVKIAKAGKSINREFAHKYYDSIGLGIDFTARDLQKKCKEKGHPWEVAKAFEHSAPISATFIPKENLDLSNIQFRLEQNGNVVQDGNSSDMIFDIDTLIAHVSQYFTLKTGDLIYTGTPAGVGPIAIGDTLKGFIGDREMLSVRVK